MKNVVMPAVPTELLAGIDPSAMTLNRSHKGRGAPLPKMSPKQAQDLNLTDAEVFIMLLLATVGMTSVAQMKALLTAVPKNGTRSGFDGMMNDLQARYGVTFDARKAVGRLHNQDAAYNAVYRMNKKDLVRTILQGANIKVKTELAGLGVEVGYMLTRRGAAVLLALSTHRKMDDPKDNLTVKDIAFCVHDSQIGLDTQIHQLGIGSFLTSLCVGGAYYSNRSNPIVVDVAQVIGDGRDFEVNKVKVFRPDLSCVVFIQSVFVPFFLEWDTDRSTAKTVTKKTKNYIRLMCESPTDTWKSGRPWLVFATPSEERIAGYQKAIREAAKFSGLLDTSTYEASDWVNVAVCTYGDIGNRSPYGAIYRVFDFKTGKLTDEKFTLVSLHRSKVATTAQVVDEPVTDAPKSVLPPQWNKVIEAVGEEAANGANPPEWAKNKRGAASRLIGYFEEDVATTASPAALVLNGGE